MSRISLFAILFSIASVAASAHAPVVNDRSLPYSKEQPFVVNDPEHSKAIFSELQGQPQYYRIDATKPFRFYAGITMAKLDTCDRFQSFSFEVLDANFDRIDGRNGRNFDWWPWFEEYGKTWYWVGPEIGADFKGNRTYQPGTYWIKVFNQSNTGKYVLAVGDIERFGLGTIAGMLVNRTMNKVRNGWWDESLCP